MSDEWEKEESSEYGNSIDVDASQSELMNVGVAEDLFIQLTEAWLERRGPTLFKSLQSREPPKKYTAKKKYTLGAKKSKLQEIDTTK